METPNGNLIDLEPVVLERLGTIAEQCYRVYSGRAYMTVGQLRIAESRYKHLSAITHLFEVIESQEEVA